MSKPVVSTTGLTRAQIWTKGITTILRIRREPTSTWRLLNEFESYVKSNSIWDPGSAIGALCPIPNLGFLEWMAEKNIISKHTFQNRKYLYWGYGLNVNYPNASDNATDDQEVLDNSSKKKYPKKGKEIPLASFEKEANTRISMLQLMEQVAVLEAKVESLEVEMEEMRERTNTGKEKKTERTNK